MPALTRVRYTITHRGAPIGTVDAHRQKEFAAGPVTPLPAYEALRPQVTAATRALRDQQAVESPANPASHDQAKGGETNAKELGYELELQDDHGEPVAVDSIWLNDLGAGSKLSAIIIFKGASSIISDMLRPGGRR